VDHPAPAVTALASGQSSSASTTIIPPLERWVGRVTAAAALTVLEALDEYQDRGLSPAIKTQIGAVYWRLYQARQLLVPHWDFDSIARIQGTAALRAADVSPGLAKIAIDAVMETLHKTIRDTLN